MATRCGNGERLSAYFNTHTFERNAPLHNGHFWGGALRDDAKNGCERV